MWPDSLPLTLSWLLALPCWLGQWPLWSFSDVFQTSTVGIIFQHPLSLSKITPTPHLWKHLQSKKRNVFNCCFFFLILPTLLGIWVLKLEQQVTLYLEMFHQPLRIFEWWCSKQSQSSSAESLDEEQLSTRAEGTAGECNCPLVKDTEKNMENQEIHIKTVWTSMFQPSDALWGCSSFTLLC